MISPQIYNNYLGSAKKSPIKIQKSKKCFRDFPEDKEVEGVPGISLDTPSIVRCSILPLGESRFYFTRIFLPLWM